MLSRTFNDNASEDRNMEPLSVDLSDKVFKLGDGHAEKASLNITQPVTAGILRGKTRDLHCIDKGGNDTLTLFPISYPGSRRSLQK